MRFSTVLRMTNLSRIFIHSFLCYFFVLCSSSIPKTKRKKMFIVYLSLLLPILHLKTKLPNCYHCHLHKINKLLAVVKRYQMCTWSYFNWIYFPSCNMQKRHLYSNHYFLAHKRLQNSSIFKHKFLKYFHFLHKIYFCTYGWWYSNFPTEKIVNKFHVWNNKRSLAIFQDSATKYKWCIVNPVPKWKSFLLPWKQVTYICVEYSNTKFWGRRKKNK